jgi:hypothetical protein
MLIGAEDILLLEYPHCSYPWKSKSKGDRVCCPRCRKSFRKRKGSKNRKCPVDAQRGISLTTVRRPYDITATASPSLFCQFAEFPAKQPAGRGIFIHPLRRSVP